MLSGGSLGSDFVPTFSVGTPTGPKAQQRIGLPPYLTVAPTSVRRRFAAVYLLNRGTTVPEGSAYELVLREEREETYLAALAAFLGSLTDGAVEFADRWSIYLDAEAVGELAVKEDTISAQDVLTTE